MAKNPSLVVTIWDSMTKGGDSLESAVLHAAVHAWFEGHIEAHRQKGEPAVGDVAALKAPMPSPPFPPPDSALLGQILSEVEQRYQPDVILGAIAHAGGLGWAAGFRDGQACKGCAYRGLDPTFAEALRDGRVCVTIDPENDE